MRQKLAVELRIARKASAIVVGPAGVNPLRVGKLFATVLPREARDTASKPFFWGVALTSFRLIALLTRKLEDPPSKDRSFRSDSWPLHYRKGETERRI